MWNSQSYSRRWKILKLIETYKGEVDEEFWATIASKLFYGSGGPGNINGW